MKSKLALAISLGLNVCLLLIWLSGTRSLRSASEPAVSLIDGRPQLKWQVLGSEITITNRDPFQWSMVESPEYRQYVINLRKIGCPENTLRNIVERDVLDLYLEKRRKLFQPFELNYWDYSVHGPERAQREFGSALGALEDEATYALKELVGSARVDPIDKLAVEKATLKREIMLNFLPDAKRQELERLLQKFQSTESAASKLVATDPNGSMALAAARGKKEEEIQRLLTPEEYSEYKLRDSDFSVPGSKLELLDATEIELRELARVQQEIMQRSGKIATNAAALSAPGAGDTREERLRSILGDERFKLYEMEQDSDFHAMLRVTERYDIAGTAAIQSYNVLRGALRDAEALAADDGTAPPERVELLRQIQVQAMAEIESILGKDAANAYAEQNRNLLARILLDQQH